MSDESAFVKVWSRRTGIMHRVPQHFLENPHLMKPFRRTPGPEAEVSPEPSESWSLADLRAEAEKRDVDLTGAGRSKASILERLAAAKHPTTIDPVSADPTTQVSPDTVSDDETPAEG